MLKSINRKLFKSVSVVLLFSCLFLFSENCFSQNVDTWQDQSGDLPGTSDNTWIYVTVGVVAVAALVYFIFIAPSGDKSNDESKEKSSDKSSNLKNFNSGYLNSFRKDLKDLKSDYNNVKFLKNENLTEILKKGLKQESLLKKSLNKIEITDYSHGLEMRAENK